MPILCMYVCISVCLYTHVSEVPRNHYQVQWFAKMTQYVVVLTAITYWSERVQSTISKGKRHMGHSPGDTRHKLLRVFSQDTPKSSSSEMWQLMWNVCQGSSTDTQCSACLSGASHIGAFCLAYNRIPDSRRNVCVQQKPYCLHKQFRLSEPFLLRTGKNPPEIRVPRCQPRNTLVADHSEDSSLRPALLILSPQHTYHISVELLPSFHLFFSYFPLFYWTY